MCPAIYKLYNLKVLLNYKEADAHYNRFRRSRSHRKYKISELDVNIRSLSSHVQRLTRLTFVLCAIYNLRLFLTLVSHIRGLV